MTKELYFLFDTACIIRTMHCIQLHYLVYQGGKILAHAANDSKSSSRGWFNDIWNIFDSLALTESLTAFQDILTSTLKFSSPKLQELTSILWQFSFSLTPH